MSTKARLASVRSHLRDIALAAWPGALSIARVLGAPGSLRASRGSRISPTVEGVRENQLVGYGLVTGLNGTGDTLNNCPMTKQSLHGDDGTPRCQHPPAPTCRTANMAAVMVTANLPAFATQGTRLDVTVSAMCDAKIACRAATLLATPLAGRGWRGLRRGAGQPRDLRASAAEGDAAKVTRGVPTVGRIANGALIEREVDFQHQQPAEPAPLAAQP